MTQRTDKATQREWLGLAAIALPCLVYAMDLTVLHLALPAIAAELSPSASQQLWIADIYGFMVAGFLITMGTVGDRIGRRRLLLIGAAAFGLASIVAAMSKSAEMLVATRALLGIAGATLAPSTLSLIRNMFHDEHERQFAIGIWIASFSAGGVIGPLAGGLVLQWFHWSAVFWIAVPVMAMVLVVGPRLLPESRDPDAGRLDLPSAALSLGSVLAAVYGFKRLAEGGWPALAFVALALALVLGIVFARRQRRIDYPLLDLTLFGHPVFRAAIVIYATTCLAMFGIYFHNLQYLQGVQGLSALAAGAVTIPGSIAFVVGSLATPGLTRRVSPESLLVGGTWAAAISCVPLALLPWAGPHATAVLAVATTAVSLAMAPVVAVANQIVVSTAPPERAGAASALSETSAEFSGALGIALAGIVGTLIYRHGLLAGHAAPPPEALATLGGALASAAASPDGAALLGAARAAFADAQQAVAAVAGLSLAAAAALATRLLRRRPSPARAASSVGLGH